MSSLPVSSNKIVLGAIMDARDELSMAMEVAQKSRLNDNIKN